MRSSGRSRQVLQIERRQHLSPDSIRHAQTEGRSFCPLVRRASMTRNMSRAATPVPKKGGKTKWDPVVNLSINLPSGQSFQTELVWDLRRPERSDKPAAAGGAPSSLVTTAADDERAATKNSSRDPDIVAFEIARALSLDAVEMLRIASDIRRQLRDLQQRPLEFPRRLREDRKAMPVMSKPMKGTKLQSHAIAAAPGDARAPLSVPKKRKLISTSETVLKLPPHPREAEALPVKKEMKQKRKEARIVGPEGKKRKVEEPAKNLSASANPGDGETLRLKEDFLKELIFRCALCNVQLKGRGSNRTLRCPSCPRGYHESCLAELPHADRYLRFERPRRIIECYRCREEKESSPELRVQIQECKLSVTRANLVLQFLMDNELGIFFRRGAGSQTPHERAPSAANDGAVRTLDDVRERYLSRAYSKKSPVAMLCDIFRVFSAHLSAEDESQGISAAAVKRAAAEYLIRFTHMLTAHIGLTEIQEQKLRLAMAEVNETLAFV